MTLSCLLYALPIYLESLDSICGFTAAGEDHLTTDHRYKAHESLNL